MIVKIRMISRKNPVDDRKTTDKIKSVQDTTNNFGKGKSMEI